MKPLKLAQSPSSGRYYAFRSYRETSGGIVVTGKKEDITDEIKKLFGRLADLDAPRVSQPEKLIGVTVAGAVEDRLEQIGMKAPRAEPVKESVPRLQRCPDCWSMDRAKHLCTQKDEHGKHKSHDSECDRCENSWHDWAGPVKESAPREEK